MLCSNLRRISLARLPKLSIPSSCVGLGEVNPIVLRCHASSDSKDKGPKSPKNKNIKTEKDKAQEDRWHGKGKLIQKLDLGFKKKTQILADQKSDGPDKEIQIPDRLLKAVKSVAEDLGGDVKQTESELVQKLKDQASNGNAKINLSEVFVGMKIDRSGSQKPSQGSDTSSPLTDGSGSRAHRVRKVLEDQNRYQRPRGPSAGAGDRDRQEKRDRSRQFMQRERDRDGARQSIRRKVDLFGARPLGIFSPKPASEYRPASELPKLATWDALEAKEIKLAVTHPPRNGFEEMILWTEQGKLWTFPIDNEKGLDEEAKFSFHEHIFLEPLIEPWCPKKGPVRHFMELVCVGLGRNHFMTVKEKHEYIEWYHQFFLHKSSVLKETGAGEVKQ